MSAGAMSAMIRAKKKKMAEDHSDAVKLSGIPEDATDIMTIKGHEATDAMNMHDPMDRNEDPELSTLRSEEMAAQPHNEESPDPHVINMDMDEEKSKKRERIRATMMRMK